MTLREDDIVLCTVKKIEGTTIFLEVEGNGTGTMPLSEVAPGRIRNLREFITVGKKVVCKILKIRDGHPELSLRRVTAKERELVKDRYKKEKTLISALTSILGDNAQKIVIKIKESYDIEEFLKMVKESPNVLEKFVPEQKIDSVQKLFLEKPEKEKEIKRVIIARTLSESGLNDLKSLLNIDNAEIRYLGSSNFSMSVKDTDFKKANAKMEEIIKALKDKAKHLHIQFDVK
jgi:translation initiation factor 2 alpha subunit (eIF-2alpha)